MAGRYDGNGLSAKIHRSSYERLYKRVRAVAERNDRRERAAHAPAGIQPQNSVSEHTLRLDQTVEIGPGLNLNDKKPWMPPSDWYIKYCEAYDRLKKEVKEHGERA